MTLIILAAGQGSRLFGIEKVLISIDKKYLVQYSLDNAILLKPEKIIIVIRKESKIPETFGRYYNGIHIEYIIQPEPLGTIDALKRSVSSFPFFLMLGDEILIEPKVEEMVRFYKNQYSLDGVLGYCNGSLEEVKKTYSIEKFNNIIISLTEKPINPTNNLVGTGYCIIGRDLFKEMINSKEKNFVEAINRSIKGKRVKIFEICSKYFNINTFQDLLKARKVIENYNKNKNMEVD